MLGDRTLFRRSENLQTDSTFPGGLPFAKFAKGGPLFSFFFPASPQLTTRSRALWHLSRWSNLRRSNPRIDLQYPLVSIIKTPTAPRPVPRMFHKFCFNRIRMNVVQLLLHFRARIDVKIVIPPAKIHRLVLLTMFAGYLKQAHTYHGNTGTGP